MESVYRNVSRSERAPTDRLRTSPSPGVLPQSGSDVRGYILVGLTLAASGVAIVLTARRRRSTV